MADNKQEVRIDKWMWATRIFKSRTIAVEACKKGRVLMHNMPVKPSRNIKLGDIVQIRKQAILYSFEVVGLTERRVGAKLVSEYLKDVTPKEQLDILEAIKMTGFVNRSRGSGRPTKKERRDLDSFSEGEGDFFDFDFDFDSEED